MSNDEILCEHDGEMQLVYHDYVLPIIFLLAAISMLPFIYIYLKAYFNGDMKTKKPLFYGGSTLFIIILIAYITFIFWALYKCHDYKLRRIFLIISSQLYVMQTILLLAILFYRLYYVFKPTGLRLSKSTVAFFVIYIILVSVLFGFGAIYYAFGYGSLFGSAVGIFLIFLIIFLVYLFVYKLFTVYKTTQDKDLINIITKTSLLTFISTFITMLTFMSAVLSYVFSEYYFFSIILDIVSICDMYTNFLCIFLSYKCFSNHYVKICGCCDTKCHQLWVKCAHNKDQEMMTKVTEANIATDIQCQHGNRE